MVFEEIYKKSRGQGIRVSSLPEAKHLDIFWFLLVLEHTFSFVPCANGALLSCSTRTRLPPSELKGRLLVMMGDVDLHVAVRAINSLWDGFAAALVGNCGRRDELLLDLLYSRCRTRAVDYEPFSFVLFKDAHTIPLSHICNGVVM